jgi:glyoxylate reductase
MGTGRTKVIVTRRLPAAIEARMAELFEVELSSSERPWGRDQLVDALGRAETLVPALGDRIGPDELDRAGPGLKLIANYGSGVDHIDVAGAHARGIIVTNTPGVLTEDTADMAMALILAVARRMKEGITLMQSGDWQGWSPTALMGSRVGGRALGILGMGRIGQAVARRARAFGMTVHYNSRSRLHPEAEAALGATWWESLDQMLARVDVLSVNTPHTPATYHLLNARRLKLMKPTSIVINTSRGEVFDENALTRMLRSGEIAGAGLDVYEHGARVNPRLLALPNVVLLPHMGSATAEGRLEMGERVILNIRTFADGHRPPDRVLPDMI